MRDFWKFQDLKLRFVLIGWSKHSKLKGDINLSLNAGIFMVFPLAFIGFPWKPPWLKIVDFSGIFDDGGPKIQDIGTARGKII